MGTQPEFRHPSDSVDLLLARLSDVPGVSVAHGDGVGYDTFVLRSLYDYGLERDQVRVRRRGE